MNKDSFFLVSRRWHSHSIRLVFIVCASILCKFACDGSENNIFSHDSEQVYFDGITPSVPSQVTVGAYYYPWHYSHFQVNIDGYVRKELTPRQEIRLGEYDDRFPSVIQQHLEWSKRANIDVWVTSWWGPQSGEDQTLRDVILNKDKVDLGNHKIALLYETTGRIREKENYDINRRVPGDFDYICRQQRYFDHPNYYRINGRPVLVIYLTRLLDGKEILDDVIPIIREKCSSDVYIIGDQVWGSPPATTLDLLDGYTNYDIYGNMGRPRYARQEGVDQYYRLAEDWKAYAASHDATFIPAVAPGYNDRGVRLQKNNPALSRRLDENSEEGSLFAAQLVRATQLLDAEADNFMLVNSFNEWHEDTQIEPCDGKTATEPFVMTQGLEYTGYGTLYLDILATYTAGGPRTAQSSLPVRFTGPPTARANLAAYYWSWHTKSDFDSGLRNNLLPSQASLFGEGTDTVRQDLQVSWEANITTWILPWKPPPHVSNDGAQRLFANQDLVESDHRLGLYYYVTDRIIENSRFDLSQVSADVKYLCENYLKTPTYLTDSADRPILFLALTRTLSDQHLSQVTNTIRAEAASTSCGRSLFLVGDDVWGTVEGKEDSRFESLDAVMNKDVYGNLGASSNYPGISRLEEYFEDQRLWRLKAWDNGCSYIPTIIPGFNDRAVRGATNEALSRRLSNSAEESSWFKASLDRAEFLLDSDTRDLIIINSLNHFAEDTQIYPVCGDDTDAPFSLTEGLEYAAYGTTYLQILKERYGSYEGREGELLSACDTVITNFIPNQDPALDNPFVGPFGQDSVDTENPVTLSIDGTLPPSLAPTAVPTQFPTLAPTRVPTQTPTTSPSKSPSTSPTVSPTPLPTKSPTMAPSRSPTASPSLYPTQVPTKAPSLAPSKSPSFSPSLSSENDTCRDDPSFQTSDGRTCSSVRRRRCRRTRDEATGRRATEMCLVQCGVCELTPANLGGTAQITTQPGKSPTASPSLSSNNDTCRDDPSFQTSDGRTCSSVRRRSCRRTRDEATGRRATEMCLVQCGVCELTPPSGPAAQVDLGEEVQSTTQPPEGSECTFLAPDVWTNLRGQTCGDIEQKGLGRRRTLNRLCRVAGTVFATGQSMTGVEACGLVCQSSCRQ